jgi:hypothetical protein
MSQIGGAVAALAWIFPVGGFRELAARRADKDIFRVPGVGGKKISGKQVYLLSASTAFCDLYPKEIFDVRIITAANATTGTVEMAYLPFQLRPQQARGLHILRKIQVLNFLANNPVRHGIDVKPGHIAPEPVGLKDRCAAPHERVGDMATGKTVRRVKRLAKRPVRKLRQQQAAKQGPRPPGKPLVHSDHRPVVLLNLLLS